MITRSPRWRVRRRPLLYGIAVMLSGITIALAALSVVGHLRYQRLAAESAAATAKAVKAETFAYNMGLSTVDGKLLLSCGPLGCSIALKPGTAMAGDAVRSEYLRIVSKSGNVWQKDTDTGWCEMRVDLFRPPAPHVPTGSSTSTVSAGHSFSPVVSSRPSSPYAIPDCLADPISPNNLMGIPGPDGKTRITAVIRLDRVDHIDFLDETGKAIISVQVSQDAQGKFRLTAPDAADGADQAAKDSMKNLLAVSGGALLTFIALSAFSRIAARGRFRPRRTPQRQGRTGNGIRHQPYSDNTWTDRVTMGLIASAVRALDHPDDQDRYQEEWSADSDEIPGEWQRLRWALLLRLCAPTGIRAARRDALSMSPPQQQ